MRDDRSGHPAPSAREMVLVAAGQGSIMAFGGVLALLIAQLFGKNADTDAFFAAYGVYAVGISFTSSFRLTAVPRLVGGDDANVTRMLGATLLMAAAFALPMVVASPLLGELLVDVDPNDVAPETLRLLAIALAGQLFAAMLATVLTVRGSFKAIGVATLLVGLVSVGAFLATERALGISAAALGLAVGGLWLAGVLAAVLIRTGWRPAAPARGGFPAIALEAGHLAFASVTFLAATLSYVVCVAVASREGAGEATVFAYAYVLMAILLGLTAYVAAQLRSPAIVASDDRTREAAAVGLWSFRFTVVLAGPALAAALLAGKPVIGFVLGDDFSGSSASSMLLTVVCLIGWMVGTAVGLFAIVELLARGQLRRLALLAALQVLAVAVAAPLGAGLGDIEGIAVALSLVTLAATGVQLRWAFGEAWAKLTADLVQAVARETAVVCAGFGPSALLLIVLGTGPAVIVVAVALATVLAPVATAVAWPREARAALRLLPGRS